MHPILKDLPPVAAAEELKPLLEKILPPVEGTDTEVEDELSKLEKLAKSLSA